jgi:hypothetical protein
VGRYPLAEPAEPLALVHHLNANCATGA